MFSQRYAHFLDLLPSQVAAASILAAINISISKSASGLRGMRTIDERRLRDHIFDVNVHGSLDHPAQAKDARSPYRHWNAAV